MATRPHGTIPQSLCLIGDSLTYLLLYDNDLTGEYVELYGSSLRVHIERTRAVKPKRLRGPEPVHAPGLPDRSVGLDHARFPFRFPFSSSPPLPPWPPPT